MIFSSYRALRVAQRVCGTSFLACRARAASYRSARARAKLFSTTNQFSWFIEFALAGVRVLSRDFAERIVSRSGCRRRRHSFLINALWGPGARSRAFTARETRRYFTSSTNFCIEFIPRAALARNLFPHESKMLRMPSKPYLSRNIYYPRNGCYDKCSINSSRYK